MAKKKKKKALKKALRKNLKKNVKRIKALKLQRALLMVVWAVCAGGLLFTLVQLRPQNADANYSHAAQGIAAGDIRTAYLRLNTQLGAFENKEKLEEVSIVPNSTIASALGQYNLDFGTQNYSAAKTDLARLSVSLAGWNKQLNSTITASMLADTDDSVLGSDSESSDPTGSLYVPIIMYHFPPSDFETQLQYLVDNGYTTITPNQLAQALYNHGTLPKKPVLITFDDGYEVQMSAFYSLQKYNMKATFYIITGGPNSDYCIGANRTNTSCGQPYLSWSQIRALDKSGIITIGCHTVDHPELATLTDAEQNYEIGTAKAEIQKEIGHSINSFAYPYGNYDQTTIAILKADGFTTAVTTNAGDYQSASNGLTLYRERSVYGLQ
jgi:peptidoglycan/xylan/chitin deacetylase (PgdA/CDA1 family)